MRDYWLTQSLLQAVGWGYVLAVAIALLLAGWAPRRNKVKVLAVLAVLVIASILPIKGYRQYLEQQQIAQERRERYRKAKALFDERCKAAGEKIYKTVKGVGGIYLRNIRFRDASGSVLTDPNWPDAALPHEPGGDGYIINFLLWEHHEDKRTKKGYLNATPSDMPGYKFVEVRGGDGFIYRYQLKIGDRVELTKNRSEKIESKYEVAFENFVDSGDRALWVAGTKVTILELKSRELIAEKVWYAMDPGLGDVSGGRLPWAAAKQCPAYVGWNAGATRFFVDRVLNK